MNDTNSAVIHKMRQMIQMRTPIERLKMGCSMYETSRYIIIRTILEKNPNISKFALRREIFLTFYDKDFTQSEREKIIKHLEKSS